MIELMNTKKTGIDKEGAPPLISDRQSLPSEGHPFSQLIQDLEKNEKGDAPFNLADKELASGILVVQQFQTAEDGGEASNGFIQEVDSELISLATTDEQKLQLVSEEGTSDTSNFSSIFPQLSVKDKELMVKSETLKPEKADLKSSGLFDIHSINQDSVVSVESAKTSLSLVSDEVGDMDSAVLSEAELATTPQNLSGITEQASVTASEMIAEIDESVENTEDNETLFNISAESEELLSKESGQLTPQNVGVAKSESVEVDEVQAAMKFEVNQTNLAEEKSDASNGQAVIPDEAIASSKRLTNNTNSSSTSSNTSQSSSVNQNTTPSNGQQFSQGQQGQQQSSQSNQQFVQQQMAMNQQMQKQQVSQEQQAILKAVTEGSLTPQDDKAEKILGDLGVGLDKRSTMPTGLQSITTSMKSPQWGQALGQRVVYMANNKIQEAKITLNPEKLGPVQIKIQVDKDQQINVQMTAQHGTTREALENAMPRLREMLETAGISFGSLDVGHQRDFDQQEFAEENFSHSASSTNSNDAQVEEETTTVIQSDNLVDYYA